MDEDQGELAFSAARRINNSVSNVQNAKSCSRRQFLKNLILACGGGVLGIKPLSVAAEPALETTRIRLSQIAGICIAPQYVVKELLPAEGFREIQYVPTGVYPYPAFASGAIDIALAFIAPFLIELEAGAPLTILGGIHTGCFELFGTGRVRAIRDSKGKSVGVPQLGSAHHLFVASMAEYVGLEPQRDIHWVTHDPAESARVLASGKVDALIGFPPVPQELRAKNIGHVIVNSAVDRPWSQYFCCVVVANRNFVRKHPVATKRALRAILKATDICVSEPARAAQMLVESGFTREYRYALQALKEVPYDKWREYDPEDTVRFYGLSLHDIGMIKTSPNKLIAQGTDWRFLKELKKELKG